MKAYRIREMAGVESARLEELPDPVPGPGEVLVRVGAASLNYRDLMMVRGQYRRSLPRPLIPLSDGAGTVVGVGAGVGRFRVGDRVTGCFMPGWVEGPPTEEGAGSALGGEADGVLAELVALPETGVVATPPALSDEEAATLPCAAVTAWNGLFEGGEPLRPGESVLVQGTGGVSIFALQFAVAAGARVILTSSSDEKLRRGREMGASDGINYKATSDWDKAVLDLTGGLGVDRVVEVGGAGTLGRSVKAVKRGGQVPLIGVLSGPSDFNPFPALVRAVTIRGIFVGSRAMFERMNRLIEGRGIKPVVDRTFGFDEAVAAYKHLESGAHFGKVVIRVGS